MYEFTEKDAVSAGFFSFKKIGDTIQGTFVGRSQKPNNYKPGEMQQIYELITEGGNIVLIGGKPGIDIQMQGKKFGQIIEFKFISEQPNKDASKSATKIIQVFADSKVVNKEWLEQNARQTEGEESEEPTVEPIVEEGVDVDEALKSATDDVVADKLSVIGTLAKEKLQVTDIKDVKIKVAEVTGLAVIAMNYDKIIETLRAL